MIFRFLSHIINYKSIFCYQNQRKSKILENPTDFLYLLEIFDFKEIFWVFEKQSFSKPF